MLHHLIELILPGIIGIFVVSVGAFRAFFIYLHMLVTRQPIDVKLTLLNAMETGLEFKMAAEILKTVLVRDVNELMIVGAVILLRALLTFIIH
ncbi:MAG: DUF1622 domain-containing protein, partial [Oscillospiraceae bacterium]